MKKEYSEQELNRRKKLNNLKELGRNPYFSTFVEEISIKELEYKYMNLTKEELNNNPTKEYSIAGRVMMIRNQGKAMFIAIKSNGKSFQFYVRQDSIPEKD